MQLQINPKNCTCRKNRVTARYKFHVHGKRKSRPKIALKTIFSRSIHFQAAKFFSKPLQTLKSLPKPLFDAQILFKPKFSAQILFKQISAAQIDFKAVFVL